MNTARSDLRTRHVEVGVDQLPLTTAALLAALAAVAHRDRWVMSRSLLLAALGAGLIVIGKFWLDQVPLVYTGAGALLLATFWRGGTRGCPTCTTEACQPEIMRMKGSKTHETIH